MKKITILIIFVSLSLFLYGQNLDNEINFVTISYNGDSTLFTEKYEIHKRKIYSITHITNYLDVKGVKYKTRVRVKKKNRLEIYELIEKLNLLSENQYSIINDKKLIYFLSFTTSKNENKTSYFYSEEIPYELKRIFTIIRNRW